MLKLHIHLTPHRALPINSAIMQIHELYTSLEALYKGLSNQAFDYTRNALGTTL